MAHDSGDGPKKIIHLKMNGIPCEAEEGTTVLQLALRMGIYIPHWCYHPAMPIVATCRLCVVEAKEANELLTACSQRIWEGMECFTDSEKVKKARVGMLEFFRTGRTMSERPDRYRVSIERLTVQDVAVFFQEFRKLRTNACLIIHN